MANGSGSSGNRAKALADGVDPHTGEIFPGQSPYQPEAHARSRGAIRSRLIRLGLIEDR
jgi:hypothetical protein